MDSKQNFMQSFPHAAFLIRDSTCQKTLSDINVLSLPSNIESYDLLFLLGHWLFLLDIVIYIEGGLRGWDVMVSDW